MHVTYFRSKLRDMSAMFVNRRDELARLEEWWSSAPGLALVYGRRRVGKTALLARFAADRRAVFHTAAGRPAADELRNLSESVARNLEGGLRDLETRPFHDWDDLLEHLATAAQEQPLLLVLDEFPELLRTWPELTSLLRAFHDRTRGRTRLRLLLCGSAVRTMKEMQEERAPLYGRFDLRLPVHPFRPWEAAAMLPKMKPSEFALVWGLLGGVPLYLEWWDAAATVRENLRRLVCTPGGRLLMEGEYVLSAESGEGWLAEKTLYAVARGRTRYQEIQDVVGANPARTLERLVDTRLVERVVPVTENPLRTRRTIYRIADNFLAFWLGVVARHRTEIERGLGKTILPALTKELDDFMGARWEEAFRWHLRRLAAEGELDPEVVAVGPFWAEQKDPMEIDAVVLAGRRREAVLVGEAKWSKKADADSIRRGLERKAEKLPRRGDLRYAVCARERVTGSADVLRVTADEIFSA